MAVAYAGITVVGVSDSTSTNITLPAGTTAGDILILRLCWGGHTSETYDITGFTAFYENQSAFSRPNVSYYKDSAGYKVATSGDITAGYVTVSSSGTFGSSCIGTLIRVTGGASDNIQYASAGVNGSSSPSYGNSITPSYANSLLLLNIFATTYLGVPAISAQAIATSNPSWTEVNEYNNGSGDGLSNIATAWAIRPEITATGNSSCTLSATRNSNGLLIVIAPLVNASVSATPLSLTSTIVPPTLTGTANVAGVPIAITSTIVPPVVTTPADAWTKQTKNGGSWTHEQKS